MSTPVEHGPLDFPESALEGSITDRLRAVTAEVGHLPALSDASGTVLTFDELLALVDRGAAWILGQGLDPTDPVVTFLPYDRTAVVAQLAVVAAGHLLSPADHLSGPSVLKETLVAAQPAAVITDRGLEEQVRGAGFSGPVLIWDDLPDDPGDAGAPPVRGGSDPAVLSFTSGTTGASKGVLNFHRAFLAPCRAVCLEGIYGPGDRVAISAPLSFMAATISSLMALLSGAELCLFSIREEGPPAFARFMAERRITGWGSATFAVKNMAAALAGRPLPALRIAMFGGEVLRTDDLPLIRAMSAVPLELVPVYASTEIPSKSWLHLPADEEREPGEVITIGDPVPGTTIELDPLPDAAGVGEIVVVSRINSAGYWRDPELTAERYSFDPAADVMRYRTGDLGVATRAGIEIVGRSDSMVKIRGVQVHLSSVEAAVRSFPGVADVAVLAVDNGRGDRMLVAHVAGAAEDEPLDVGELRAQLRRNLPPHMAPARVLLHERLPMSARGKLDRQALEQASRDAGPEPAREPSTATERLIHAEWVHLLGRTDFGVDDDFFELGGDSLLATQLLVYLDRQFGVWQPLSTWMEATTVAAIAATVDEGLGDADERGWLTRINRGDPARDPLLVMYDLHGGAFRFRTFGDALDDQPLWGTDNPMLDGRSAGRTTLAELADQHLDPIVALFKDRPVHMVGYSASGAFLAFEIARQLLERGHEVGYLCFIDWGPVHVRHGGRPSAYRPPGSWPNRPDSSLPAARRAQEAAAQIRGAAPGERLRTAARLADLARPFDLLRAERDVRATGRVRPELRTTAMWYRMLDALAAYEFRPIDAAATLVVCDQTAKGNIAVHRRVDYASLVEPSLGWSPFLREGVDIRRVDGYHNDLMEEPYVGGVARAVREGFDDWQRRRRSNG